MQPGGTSSDDLELARINEAFVNALKHGGRDSLVSRDLATKVGAFSTELAAAFEKRRAAGKGKDDESAQRIDESMGRDIAHLRASLARVIKAIEDTAKSGKRRSARHKELPEGLKETVVPRYGIKGERIAATRPPTFFEELIDKHSGTNLRPPPGATSRKSKRFSSR